MPIYEYQCLTCDTVFEKRQHFTDEPKADCANGHSETRRLLAAPTIVFKGSGFYINDHGSSRKGLHGSKSSDESKTKSERQPEASIESS